MSTRREFLKVVGLGAGALTTTRPLSAATHPELDEDRFGVLADLTLCVGCRRCEWACRKSHDLPNEALATFDDQSVFGRSRRPSEGELTVVNRFPGRGVGGRPLNVKIQCMHCEHPACASACLVGALEKDPRGPVVYDAWKCMGCRYCMIACPFQIPAYEYQNARTPQVRKCDLCSERTLDGEEVPACVEICPVEALQFGRRSELLEIAHDRIRRHPNRYVDHVYGETEAGGTSWLYLSNQPFEELGLPALDETSPAEITEAIQHGIFKGFTGPLMLLSLLLVLGKVTSPANRDEDEDEDDGREEEK